MTNKISKHISYKEGTYSQTALRRGLDNTPNNLQLKCMKDIAEDLFEPLVNSFLGRKILNIIS